MRVKFLILGLASVALLASSVGYVAVGSRLYQSYHSTYATYQFAPAGPCGALIAWSPPPSLYVGLYANSGPLTTIRFRSQVPQTLHLSLTVPQVTQSEIVDVDAAPSFQQVSFKPPLVAMSALDAWVGPNQRADQILLRVTSDQGTICTVSSPVQIRSRYWMHWDDVASGGDSGDLAGWVTPYAPAVVTLVGQSASWMHNHPALYPGTPALFGYNDGHASVQDVRNQVNAIFDTLQSVYRVHYASDNPVYSGDQRIQLPQDILSNPAPTGMCLETTAIMASAVEYLGMHPYIIIVPGHAYLGVATGPQLGASVEYWETSYLNGSYTGSQANVGGDEEYATDAAAGRILQRIDILYERGLGIEPIE